MKKRCRLGILLVLVLVVFSISVFAEEVDSNKNSETNYDVSLTLTDFTSNEPIQNVTLNYMVNGIRSSTYIDDAGLLRLSLPQGNYNLVIEAFESSLQYTSYYGTFDIKLNSENTTISEKVYMYPVGLLRGFVKDSLDNIIPNAELKFECIAKVIIQYPKKTDKFGFFKVENTPVSSCKIIASYEEAIGMTEVEVVKGELSEVTINLDNALLKKTGYEVYQYLAVLLGILVVFIIIWYFNNKGSKYKLVKTLAKPKVLEQKTKKKDVKTNEKNVKTSVNNDNESIMVNTKISTAILNTLNSKEKAVVEFLLANENKASQAKVRHATCIPRTSLSRVLQSLEQKKIAHIEKHGKMVNIALTDFFLGKN